MYDGMGYRIKDEQIYYSTSGNRGSREFEERAAKYFGRALRERVTSF